MTSKIVLSFDGCGTYSVEKCDVDWHGRKFASLAGIADALRALSPPKTVDKWESNAQIFAAVAPTRSSGSWGDPDSYTSAWLLRAFLIPEMRAAGISSLKTSTTMKASALHTMFPDQHDWARKLARRTGQQTVVKLMATLRFDGPVELFTCWLCVIGDPSIQQLSAVEIEHMTPAIHVARQCCRDKFGYKGHPVEIVRAARTAAT